MAHSCVLGVELRRPRRCPAAGDTEPLAAPGGIHHNFRPLSLISGILSSADPSRDDNWRTVAVIRSSTPMQLPSAETLRKNIPDWNRPEASPSGESPMGHCRSAGAGNSRNPGSAKIGRQQTGTRSHVAASRTVRREPPRRRCNCREIRAWKPPGRHQGLI